MVNISEWVVLVRLVFSGVLAGLIGLERESHGRPAGLRTHILVSLGSCLIMIISIYGFSGPATRDPARLAAQVVSGIGFLGAGTILREGVSIRGLTTAASLWVVAGIGLAIGCGFYVVGLVTTILSVLTLLFLEPFEKKLFSFKIYHLEIKIGQGLSQLSELTASLYKHGWNVKHLELDMSEDKSEATMDLIVEAKGLTKEHLLSELAKINGINRIVWK
jgi:putative Mg2+ transporter-C (MgtC) family protein